jgi:hypothetical protein
MSFFGGIFTAITGIFNYIVGRSNAKNAADVKAAQKGKDEVMQVDKTNKAIEKRDTKEMQNELSE